MKRGRKRKTEVVDLQALRQELYAKHMGKIHPTIEKNLQLDGKRKEKCTLVKPALLREIT